MMANISQLPGVLDLTFVQGDEFTFQLDFGTDLDGYTFESKAGSVEFEILPVDLATGQIQLTLSAEQTAVFTAASWYFSWVEPGDIPRTILRGMARPT
jgi:hypothetical protein